MLERKETKPQQQKLMCVNYTTGKLIAAHAFFILIFCYDVVFYGQ